jgi:diamine N-acetyltransferase
MNDDSSLKVLHASTDADARLVAVLGAVTGYEAYYRQDDSHNLAGYITETSAPEKIRAEVADPNCTFFIIFDQGKAVGFAKMRRDSVHESVTSGNAIELQRIYIIEHVYGTGAGEFLFKHCIAYARAEGFETLWLGVWEQNARARRFYEKHGLRRVGTLDFPYGSEVGINHVMQLDLVPEPAI